MNATALQPCAQTFVRLPDGQETLLLQACLLSGQAGSQAWERWKEVSGDSSRCKRLWPLLARAVRRNDLDVEQGLRTKLNAALLAERARYTLCRRVALQVSSLLTSEGHAPVVLPGVALAETVYDEPALRHCHQLNLLIPHGDLEAAAATLSSRTFARTASTRPGTVRLQHETGWPVVLSAMPAPISEREIASGLAAFQVPSPEASLWLVLCDAPERNDFLFSWICDARHLLDHHSDMNWTRFQDILRLWGSLNAVPDVLRFLSSKLRVPVPSGLLEQPDIQDRSRS